MTVFDKIDFIVTTLAVSIILITALQIRFHHAVILKI